jgi:hypothetical protein
VSVYVDDGKEPYRGMLMSHMCADTTEELLAMADRIGIARKWIQHPGTYREHFDVCQSKRSQAVSFGAELVSRRELVRRNWAKIGGPSVPSLFSEQQ